MSEGGVSPKEADARTRLRTQMNALVAAHRQMLTIERLWDAAKTESQKKSPDHERVKEMEERMMREAQTFFARIGRDQVAISP
jgi:hypothetical protein